MGRPPLTWLGGRGTGSGAGPLRVSLQEEALEPEDGRGFNRRRLFAAPAPEKEASSPTPWGRAAPTNNGS